MTNPSTSRERIHVETRRIDTAARILNQLAAAFGRTGNPDMDEELQKLANLLRTSSEEIREAVGDWITSDLRDAEASSRAMLEGVLAGLSLNPSQK